MHNKHGVRKNGNPKTRNPEHGVMENGTQSKISNYLCAPKRREKKGAVSFLPQSQVPHGAHHRAFQLKPQ